jgi:hypothetical protein
LHHGHSFLTWAFPDIRTSILPLGQTKSCGIHTRDRRVDCFPPHSLCRLYANVCMIAQLAVHQVSRGLIQRWAGSALQGAAFDVGASGGSRTTLIRRRRGGAPGRSSRLLPEQVSSGEVGVAKGHAQCAAATRPTHVLRSSRLMHCLGNRQHPRFAFMVGIEFEPSRATRILTRPHAKDGNSE